MNDVAGHGIETDRAGEREEVLPERQAVVEVVVVRVGVAAVVDLESVRCGAEGGARLLGGALGELFGFLAHPRLAEVDDLRRPRSEGDVESVARSSRRVFGKRRRTPLVSSLSGGESAGR